MQLELELGEVEESVSVSCSYHLIYWIRLFKFVGVSFLLGCKACTLIMRWLDFSAGNKMNYG